MADKRGILLDQKDNVGSVLEDVLPGETVALAIHQEVVRIKAAERIPFGFKIATRDIAVGDPIVKYGETIGLAGRPISRGSLVHVHNMEGARGRGDLPGNP